MINKLFSYSLGQFRHAKDTRPNRVITELKDNHDELVREGVTILPEYFDKETVNVMLSKLNELTFTPTPEMRHDAKRPLADKFFAQAEKISEFSPFFSSTELSQLIKSYISVNAHMHRAFARVKQDTGPVSSFENFYHFDAYKKRIKAFLYLTDVGPENAPVGFIKGTHITQAWRLAREIEMFSNYQKDAGGYAADQESAYLGCYWPHEIKKLLHSKGFEPITCTGKAGTVVIFDGKGLHLANQLVADKRAVLVSHWIQPGHHM
jgi:hypothetical protein